MMIFETSDVYDPIIIQLYHFRIRFTHIYLEEKCLQCMPRGVELMVNHFCTFPGLEHHIVHSRTAHKTARDPDLNLLA